MHSAYQDRQRALIASMSHDADGMAAIAQNVPMRRDHAGTPERCLTTVMFVPPPMARTIERQLQAPLRALAPWHYYSPQSALHITIKNVRNAAQPPAFGDGDIVRVQRAFAAILQRHAPIAFSFEELLAFPGSLSLIGYCDERLRTLVHDLDQCLRQLGLPDDKRYLSDEIYFGNITLCRFTRPPEPTWLATAQHLPLRPLTLTVDHVELITCNAACAPQTIQRCQRFDLGGR